MRRSSPTDLAEVFRATPGRRLILLKAAWPAAVGPGLARRSEVVALDGDLVRVRVPDAHWRRSLWRMRRDLLGRLRRIAGSAAPHALSLVEGPVTPPSGPSPAPTPPPEGRLAVLPRALAEAADRIPDEPTREQFRRAARRYLARFAAARGETDETA